MPSNVKIEAEPEKIGYLEKVLDILASLDTQIKVYRYTSFIFPNMLEIYCTSQPDQFSLWTRKVNTCSKNKRLVSCSEDSSKTLCHL